MCYQYKMTKQFYYFSWKPWDISWSSKDRSKLIFWKKDWFTEIIRLALSKKYWHDEGLDIFSKVMNSMEKIWEVAGKFSKPWVFKLIRKNEKIIPVEAFRFYYDEKNSYYWKSDVWNILRFWGNPNFITESLKNLYGDFAKEIFVKFMVAMEETNSVLDKRDLSQWVFYLINNVNVNKVKWKNVKVIQSWKEKCKGAAKKIKKDDME